MADAYHHREHNLQIPFSTYSAFRKVLLHSTNLRLQSILHPSTSNQCKVFLFCTLTDQAVWEHKSAAAPVCGQIIHPLMKHFLQLIFSDPILVLLTSPVLFPIRFSLQPQLLWISLLSQSWK